MSGAAFDIGVAGLGAAYAAGGLEPVAVAEAHLARIAAQDGALRSFITVDAAGARRQAEASRQRWRERRAIGPLDGVPLALKDNIDVAGLPCTAGTEAFRDRVPAGDAAVVRRLKQQGAVVLGKLNMHEAALGATTDNPVYGRCMNPLRPGYTPGGSSGGSAAATAARFCAAALGTDTMGSVRLPAAYCGLYGFKPSQNAIATAGVMPLSFTLDTVGPLARSAEDAAIVARTLFEAPPRCARTPCTTAAVSLAGLRIGVPRQLDQVELAPPVAEGFARFLELLRRAGAEAVRIDLAAWQPAAARRAGLLVSEAEGANYYVRQLGAGLSGLSPELAVMLRFPETAGAARVVAAYEQIEAVRLACHRAFAEVDVLALPTAPQPSFPHGEAPPVNQADLTALANFARCPAFSLPFGNEPLPVGVQLLAPPGEDEWLLAVAAAADALIRQFPSA